MTIVWPILGGVLLAGIFQFIYGHADRWGWLAGQRQCLGDWWEAELRGCASGTVPTPVEPINSYSNLAYYAAGITVFVVVGTASSAVFAAAMTFLCIGSAMYHGLKTHKTAALDHAGMYGVFAALTIHTMAPEEAVWIPMAVGSGLAAWIFRYQFKAHLHSMMGLFLALTAVGAFYRGSVLLAGIAIGCFVLGFLIWNLGRRRIFGGRWAHGLWHLLTAAAMALMFMSMIPA